MLAAIRSGLKTAAWKDSTARSDALTPRLGFHSADALIAMIYLCCANIQIALPHR